MSNSTLNNTLDGYVKNAQGHFVPKDMVSDYELLRDDIVKNLIANAEKISTSVEDLRFKTIQDAQTLIEVAKDKYGIKGLGGKRGNITLNSYDGSLQVQVSVQDFLSFDERLNIAKELIDSYLKRLTENSPKELKMLISQAFEVDRKGRVSVSKILPLMKLDIKDAQWLEAMNIIKESLSVERTKSYVRFKRRDEVTGELKPIYLDISKF